MLQRFCLRQARASNVIIDSLQLQGPSGAEGGVEAEGKLGRIAHRFTERSIARHPLIHPVASRRWKVTSDHYAWRTSRCLVRCKSAYDSLVTVVEALWLHSSKQFLYWYVNEDKVLRRRSRRFCFFRQRHILQHSSASGFYVHEAVWHSKSEPSMDLLANRLNVAACLQSLDSQVAPDSTLPACRLATALLGCMLSVGAVAHQHMAHCAQSI